MKIRTIGTRLALGLVALSAISAAIGAFAYLNATKADQMNDHLKSQTLPAAHLSEDFRSSLQRQHAILQQLLISAEQSRMTVLAASLAFERSRSANLLVKLGTLTPKEDVVRILDALKSARNNYSSSSELALSVAKAGTEESFEIALDMNANSVQTTYEKYLRSADELVTATRNIIDDQELDRDVFYSPTPAEVGRYSALAVGLSVCTSLFLFFSISNPISNAVKAFREFSSGDLSRRAKVTSNDELGELLARLNHQLDNQCKAASMVEKLADGDLTTPLAPIEEEDMLCQPITRLRRSLQLSLELGERTLAGDLVSRVWPVDPGDKLPNLLFRIRQRQRTFAELAQQISACEFDKIAVLPEAGDTASQLLISVREKVKAHLQIADRLSSGNFNAQSLPLVGGDPIGRYLLRLQKNLNNSVSLINRMSDGDLSMDVTPLSEDDDLGIAIAKVLETLRRVIRSAVSSAGNLANAGSEILLDAKQLSISSCSQAAASSELASAIRLAESSLQIKVDPFLPTDLETADVERKGEQGGKAISQIVDAIRQLSERVNELEHVAAKMDMLTLAAAIEAARAGEHGLGFGVIAVELRKLGERCTTVVNEVAHFRDGAVKATSSIAEVVADIVSCVNERGQYICQIASSAGEQAAELSRAYRVVQQLDQILNDNLLRTQSMSSSADQVMIQTNALASRIGFFTLSESASDSMDPAIVVPEVFQTAATA